MSSPERRRAGSARHGRRDGHDPLVLTSQFHQRIDGDLVIGRPRGFLCRNAGFPNEGRAGMKPDRVLHCRLVAKPLLRDDMEQNRPLHLQHILNRREEMLKVVAVDGPTVLKSQFFKEQSRQNHAFGELFGSAGKLLYVGADVRDLTQELTGLFTHFSVELTRDGPTQIGGNSPDVSRDRHLVVVQNHEKIFSESPGMMQSFERHPGRHGAVPDDTDDLMLSLQLVSGFDHTEGGRHTGARMTGVEGIEFTLFPLTKSTQSTVLPKRVELLTPTSEEFVRVRLIASIPDDFVGRCIQKILQGNCELDNA